MEIISFHKMHALGNDFVLIDGRSLPQLADKLTPSFIQSLGARHIGVGFDQLAFLSMPAGEENTARGAVQVDFYNADGSAAPTCGNASCCIAQMVMAEQNRTEISLLTGGGAVQGCLREGDVWVNMGPARLAWQDVPLAHEVPDMMALPIEGAPAAVGMGNPHMVFVVEDVEAVDIETRGAKMEHHPLFPKAANVSFISLGADKKIRMRVWERGVGVTSACGSGACASAVVAAHRYGGALEGQGFEIELDGGAVKVAIDADGVWLSSTPSYVFYGQLTDMAGGMALAKTALETGDA